MQVVQKTRHARRSSSGLEKEACALSVGTWSLAPQLSSSQDRPLRGELHGSGAEFAVICFASHGQGPE